ncbi:glycine zipper domain-containing protein [Qipengyuania spongiae]|uniref:Glycine zipper domain-containing protein n=1 Tax=Qipengyuania spongiae TaxID=2909673 RepID=A0ABY5T040_9SPHN|nr:glycine zipper domain-containing protein [Qipengyuania spongiae]UVI38859.1 glycine zipper domain-containing protein [Qipengyuania spongiae]
MQTKLLLAPALALSTLGLGACAENYAVEGAGLGAAAGAGLAAITGGDFETYALAGAAIGGVVGYAKDKNDRCDGYYDNGRYVDDDCRYDDRYSRYW